MADSISGLACCKWEEFRMNFEICIIIIAKTYHGSQTSPGNPSSAGNAGSVVSGVNKMARRRSKEFSPTTDSLPCGVSYKEAY
jgi:hypothetical protein